MSAREFPPGRLAAHALRDLPPDRKRAFYAWVEAMTREADNEDGPTFAAWFRHHEQVPGDECFVFSDAETGDLLGTASLVKLDDALPADEGGAELDPPVDRGLLGVRQRCRARRRA